MDRTYYLLPQPVAEGALMIVDPLNSANNITANVFRFGDVRLCFDRANSALLSNQSPVLEPLFSNKVINC